MLTLEDIVAKTTDLPAMPVAALMVMREADNPMGSSQSVARLIEQDQALAARVLRLANSAYYGLPRKIQNISEAVVMLGMRCVRNLAMLAGTYPWLTRDLPGYGLQPRGLWEHSLAVACAAQLIVERNRRAEPDIAFTAGLLHNLGKVAVSIWFENKLATIMRYAVQEDLPFDAVERRVLGFDHTQVGEHLGRGWNLPDTFVDAMRWHHQPNSLSSPNPVVDAVHVADYLAMSLGFGLGGDGLRYCVEPDAILRCGLQDGDLEAIADGLVSAFEDRMRMFEGMEG